LQNLALKSIVNVIISKLFLFGRIEIIYVFRNQEIIMRVLAGAI